MWLEKLTYLQVQWCTQWLTWQQLICSDFVTAWTNAASRPMKTRLPETRDHLEFRSGAPSRPDASRTKAILVGCPSLWCPTNKIKVLKCKKYILPYVLPVIWSDHKVLSLTSWCTSSTFQKEVEIPHVCIWFALRPTPNPLPCVLYLKLVLLADSSSVAPGQS